MADRIGSEPLTAEEKLRADVAAHRHDAYRASDVAELIDLPTVVPDHAHGGVHPPYLEWTKVAAIARRALADPAPGGWLPDDAHHAIHEHRRFRQRLPSQPRSRSRGLTPVHGYRYTDRHGNTEAADRLPL